MILVLMLALSLRQNPSEPISAQAPSQQAASTPATPAANDVGDRLLRVRRIFVDSFGEDPVSRQFQAVIVTALSESKRFVVTENKERADAVLKGSGFEKSNKELHANSEGTVVRGAGIADSQASTETMTNARVAVRLVSNDGDVLWSTTKESNGAKYKGASADAADQVVKQLIRDLSKLGAT